MAAKAKEKRSTWQNRIIGDGEEAPDQLLANPMNFRIHPKGQQDAISAMLDEVGWVQRIIVNKRTGFVVDGHARVALAISRHEPTVPVVYVDLSDEEERIVLAALDKLGSMAAIDEEKLSELLGEAKANTEAVADFLTRMAPKAPEGKTRTMPAPIIGYSLVFDNEAQQEHFYAWLRWLKQRYPAEETIGARIDAFLMETLPDGQG